MSIWDKVQKEIDRAGTVARGALDEGKIRIELFRVRQQADKAAQALGYAVHRARRDGREMEAATLDRLHGTLLEHEAEAKKLEEQLASVLKHDSKDPPKDPPTEDHAKDPSAADAATGASKDAPQTPDA
jgi:hypothetical protein